MTSFLFFVFCENSLHQVLWEEDPSLIIRSVLLFTKRRPKIILIRYRSLEVVGSTDGRMTIGS